MSLYIKMENKYTLDQFMEALGDIKIIQPYHIELTNNGYGEFPNAYKLTREGAKRLKVSMEKMLNNPIYWI